jgi:hypothetical protein
MAGVALLTISLETSKRVAVASQVSEVSSAGRLVSLYIEIIVLKVDDVCLKGSPGLAASIQ